MLRKQQYFLKISIFLTTFLLNLGTTQAQFPPQVGLSGSSAIHKDSSIIVNWAKNCKVVRGYIDISDTTKTYNGTNRASFGTETNAIGPAGGTMDVVSLGDGGWAILSFDPPICDGPGYDFVVFENGFIFNNNPETAFLELAFVEVSSDSIHFIRFPAISLTQTNVQINTFGYLDASKIHNLAGKYIANFGTPFDLAELADSHFIDLSSIKYVKIIDVVGAIDSLYGSFDKNGNLINDPFPTPFHSGGFDLDAVGVINESKNSMLNIILYPNPAKDFIFIKSASIPTNIEVFNILGQKIYDVSNSTKLNISFLKPDVYIVVLKFENHKQSLKFVKLSN